MHLSPRFFGTLATTLLLLASPAWAGTSADVRGVVTDQSGDPLPGVTLTLQNPDLAVGEVGTVSDASGKYRFYRLPPGRGYRVRAVLPTFAPIEFSDLELRANQTYILDITLRPAKELQETIRVRGHADLVDTESVTTSTVFSSEFIAGLPVLGRDYQDILTLAPGVTDVNDTGNPNIHGARSTDVITLVDGVSSTDPFSGFYGQQLNIESIEQIEVITSGASAEYSRAQGGFANIITKSGGNEFKGAFKFFVRSHYLDQDGAGIDHPELRGGLGESESLRDLEFTDLYPFLSFAGAFVQDKLWYYLANEYIQIETPINAVSQGFVTTTRGYREFGKLTWQLNQAHKMAFSVTVDRTRHENQGLTTRTDVEAGYQFERGGPTYTLKETAVINPAVLLESSVAWFDNSFQRAPNLDADTNGNGILFIDDRPELGGNQDGILQARERDPGEDYDRDFAYDLYEDFDHDGRLDLFEDRDLDGRLTPPGGCEGMAHEDVNCNGLLDREFDLNLNGYVDPEEDVGLEGIPGTAGNGIFDTEDINSNNELDTTGNSGPTSFPFWTDSNRNGKPDVGEYQAPLFPDRDFTVDLREGRITGPNPYDYGDSRQRFTWREDLSLYVDDFGGSHDIKMGIVFENERFDRNTQLRPSLEVQVNEGQSTTGTLQLGGVVVAHLPTLSSVNNEATGDNLGFYIRDNYKPLPNLTVGIGIRLDYENLNSFGYTDFDPREERRVYDHILHLAGEEEENQGDFDGNGILDQSLCSDPLFTCGQGKSSHVAAVESRLKQIAPSRLTRHNFDTVVKTDYLERVLGRGISIDDLRANGYNFREHENIEIDNTNVAPRLSLTWDPWGDGKSKGFASWNRFYDKLFLNTVVLEEGPDTITRYYSFDQNGVDFFGRPNNQIGNPRSLAPPSAFQVDRRLSTPYTDELTLGFERELAPEFSMSLTYIHRDFKDQLQDVDINHSTRINPNTGRFRDDIGIEQVPGGFGNEATGRPVRVPDGRPDLYIENIFFNRIFRLGNFNQQTYRGYEVELVRRLSRAWQMNASYTYSKSEGDAESFLSANGDDPSLTEFESGYLSYDQRHVVKFNAITYLPRDWRLGGTIQWSSGLPFSVIDEFDAQDNVGYVQSRVRFGTPNIARGFLSENRNSHRNEAIYTINARVQKAFVIGKTSASGFFEVYNLLNTDDLRVYTVNPTFNSLQIEGERRFGRRFQFGVQLDF